MVYAYWSGIIINDLYFHSQKVWIPFHEDSAKSQEGSQCPSQSQSQAKSKALKANKAVLKGVHSHTKKEDTRITHLLMAQDTAAPKAIQISSEERFQETQTWPLCRHQDPPATGSAVKELEDNNTLVFIVDVKANKHQIRQAMKKLCDNGVAKVNTLTRPDGEKKACMFAGPGLWCFRYCQ